MRAIFDLEVANHRPDMTSVVPPIHGSEVRDGIQHERACIQAHVRQKGRCPRVPSQSICGCLPVTQNLLMNFFLFLAVGREPRRICGI